LAASESLALEELGQRRRSVPRHQAYDEPPLATTDDGTPASRQPPARNGIRADQKGGAVQAGWNRHDKHLQIGFFESHAAALKLAVITIEKKR
jgi:hypothetical protein